MRDKYAEPEHWERCIERSIEMHSETDYFALYKEKMQSSETKGPFFSLFKIYTENWIQQVSYRFSRGDDLENIKKQVINEAVDRYLRVADEIEFYRDKIKFEKPYFYGNLLPPNTIHDVLCLLSWFVCFNVDAEKLERLAPFLAPSGQDRIVDTVLAQYEPTRSISESCSCPRIHRLLDSILVADSNKRIALAEQYLERWARLMSSMRGIGILSGAALAEGAKTNADLPAAAFRREYKGFWAWELALLVRVLGIDDSSFADHDLYPADLASFRD